ncbi:RNA-binding protein 7-like [Patiria miniata]|uniref:RRM domain-containing protein n=1 Tax=Patiria miniata TaxID=46514 RepID=A0A914ARD3_PATMI|nr:RNA-binding protein 7-like [Patiria miniata]
MGEGSSRDDRTIYVKNLDNKVTEEVLFELFLQAGPLVGVKRPTDSDGNARPFAFVEFEHDVSPPYARSLMDGIRLFGRSINVQFRSGSRHSQGSQGNNSPSATPPYNTSGGQSPAPNGFQSFPTPPMVQRSMSAPQGLLGVAPGLPGFGMPSPLMGNLPPQGFFPGAGPGMVSLMQQPQFNVHLNGQPMQHLQDRRDETPNQHRHYHQGRSSQEHQRSHQRSHQGTEEEQKSRSHHRDGHRHGQSGSGHHDDRYHGDRGQHSEERRHGSSQRHHSHQQHRQERRDHPYRR